LFSSIGCFYVEYYTSQQ